MRETNRKAVVGIDVDEILADLLTPWIKWYNKKWKDKLRIENVPWRIEQIVKKECGAAIFDFLKTEDVYSEVLPLPGAVQFIKYLLNHEKVDLVLVTTAGGGPISIPSKAKWLASTFKDLPTRNIIYTNRKELVELDFFIDDSPENIRRYHETWPLSKILTIAYPYNEEIKDLVNMRGQSYKDTKKAFKQMEEYLEEQLCEF
jgi:5'(3')-deoxyribonucleotidase